MKQVTFTAIASIAFAAEASQVRGALQRQAPFSFQGQRAPGQASGFERQLPDFAAPENRGQERQTVQPQLRTGDELILKAERAKRAAVTDPILGKKPEVRPFKMNPKDLEPIDPTNKKFTSPVFLVDPMFTKDKKDEEIIVFRGNDWAGWEQPLKPSKWPIVRKEIQHFFQVNEDCSQKGMKLDITHFEPLYEPLDLPRYYAPVYEPQYEAAAKKPQAHNQKSCYQGDDFGGHNIPFPHPAPPKPDVYYADVFYDMSKHFGQLNYDDMRKIAVKVPAAPAREEKEAPAERRFQPSFDDAPLLTTKDNDIRGPVPRGPGRRRELVNRLYGRGIAPGYEPDYQPFDRRDW